MRRDPIKTSVGFAKMHFESDSLLGLRRVLIVNRSINTVSEAFNGLGQVRPLFQFSGFI